MSAAAEQQQLFGWPEPGQKALPQSTQRAQTSPDQVSPAVRASSAVKADPLFDDAVKLTRLAGKGSTSVLQRGLRIVYGRAVALIDQMERAGIVGPERGPQPRRLRRRKREHE